MSDAQRSPPKPWRLGKHKDYSAFRIVVTICQDEHGRVWSEHGFDTKADEQVAGTLQNGGVPHVAHALLVEAVRREAFTCALIQASKDAGFLARWVGASADQRAILEQELQRAAEEVLVRTIPKMLPGAVREVLDMMAAQLPGQERRG